jgi:hypothetical protein
VLTHITHRSNYSTTQNGKFYGKMLHYMSYLMKIAIGTVCDNKPKDVVTPIGKFMNLLRYRIQYQRADSVTYEYIPYLHCLSHILPTSNKH